MKLADFESLLFVDVEERAAAEPTPQPGHAKYHGRPWTRLRDEMVVNGSMTVADLPSGQIKLFYRSTKSGDEGGKAFSQRLFGGD
jgi:hypothetical protein